MVFYEESKIKTNSLENLFKALTVQLTSIESERAFSGLGGFATKVINLLQDEALDAFML